ncbi:heterokaryon incompatibility domain-containing protein [Trichoderma camerunense]
MPPSTENTHSCHFCSIQEVDINLRLNDADSPEGTVVKYRGSIVISGASNGCELFKKMMSSLFSIIGKYRGEHGGFSDPRFIPENWVCTLTFNGFRGIWESASAKWTCVIGELPGIGAHPEQSLQTYSICAYPDDPAADTILTRPLFRDYRAANSLSWVKHRLQTCDNSHQMCSSITPSFLPTRLLRLRPTYNGVDIVVRVEKTADLDKNNVDGYRYSTLSYCWGGEQSLKLTATSEEMLLRGISASSFPKTLRDAIQFTWDLGLHFIWIDCVCIRQDEPIEIATEVAKIPEIYASSYITISAARASHSRQGFLHDASLPSTSELSFKLPFSCSNGKRGSILLSPRTVYRAPIDCRSWTLQEYLLSRRVLQFTDFKFHWTCREASEFDDEDGSVLPIRHVERLNTLSDMFNELRYTGLTCKDWMNIVEEYTKRDLTHSADKLPAISGIAEYWSNQSGDSYIAGLWASHLPLALLWTSAQPFLQNDSENATNYRAPSWSWASLDGQVDWFDHLQTTVCSKLSFMDYKVKPTYEQAPFGTLTSGSLTVNGLLQETSLQTLDKPRMKSLLDSDQEFLDIYCAETHLDFLDESLASKIKGSRLFCLQICCFDEATSTGPSGLILETKDNQNFTRIGFFTFQPPGTDDLPPSGSFASVVGFLNYLQEVQRNAFQKVTARTFILL